MTFPGTPAVERALIIAIMLGSGTATGALQAPSFSADVGIVRINVAVLDDSGVPVDDLEPGDFIVLEAGRLQEITVFASPREAPLDVAILMDVSGSVKDYSGDIRTSAAGLLDLLGPTDCVYFRLLPRAAARKGWVSASDQSLREELGAVQAGGSTDMYDAVIEAVYELALRRRGYTSKRPGPGKPRASTSMPESGCAETGGAGDAKRFRRQAVVLLSDGNDTSSRETSAGLLTMIWEAQVPVFPIAVGSARSLGSQIDFLIRQTPPSRRESLPSYVRMALQAQERHRARLAEIARVSGGELIIASGSQGRDDALLDAYSTLVNRLRASYLLAYTTSAGTRGEDAPVPPWRNIEVTTTRPKTRVVSRDGYYPIPAAGLRARALVREAVEAAQRGELESALGSLSLAGQADPQLWEVDYIRGVVHGLIGNWSESANYLARSLELNPGLASAHEGIVEASLHTGDSSVAWDHAIRATLAGSSTAREQLERLGEFAAAPDDLQSRLRVPKVFVGEPDLLDLPSNLLVDRVLLAVRSAVSDSKELGLVRDPSLADLFIAIEVDELAPEPPHTFEGSLLASVRGEAASSFDTRISADLSERAGYEAAAVAAVGELQTWVRESAGEWRDR